MTELVYILSPSYSGSTLLTLLLARHPQISTVGELKHRTRIGAGAYPCSCGSDIGRCCFWSRVKAELAARGAPLDLDDLGTRFEWPDRPWLDRLLRARVRGAGFELLREGLVDLAPGCRRHLDRVAQRNQLLIQVVTEQTGGRVFLDSSKDPVRLRWLVRAGLWNVRVIHLTRDGRGTAWSAMRRDRIPMHAAATEFRRTHREHYRLASRFDSGSWTVARYEDLCRAPSAALRRLLEFLGLAVEPAALDLRSVEHHVFGNEMRLRGSSEIRLDERWKSELPDEDLAIFERIAGPTNRSLGYA